MISPQHLFDICNKEDTESLLSWFAHSCSSKRSGVQVKGGHSHSIHSSVSIACNDRLDNPPTTQRVLDASIGFLNLIETSNTYLGSLCSFFCFVFFGCSSQILKSTCSIRAERKFSYSKMPPSFMRYESIYSKVLSKGNIRKETCPPAGWVLASQSQHKPVSVKKSGQCQPFRCRFVVVWKHEARCDPGTCYRSGRLYAKLYIADLRSTSDELLFKDSLCMCALSGN